MIASDVHSLLALAHDRTPKGRETLAMAVGGLIEESDRRFTPQEAALMGDILRKLIQDVAKPIRKLLAEKMARSEFTPPEVADALANDDIDIASPVLKHSPVLTDVALMAIVHRRTRRHRMAIAARKTIGPDLSGALAACNEPDVITTLLGNHGAQISQATLVYLTEQSRQIDEIREPLLRREELDPALAKKMYAWVAAELRQYIVTRFAVSTQELDTLLAEATTEALEKAVAKNPAQDPAQSVASLLDDRQELKQDMVVQTLRRGEMPLFDAMMCRLLKLPPELGTRLIYEEEAEGFAIACRAAAFDRSTFTTLFLLAQRAVDRRLPDNQEQLRRGLELFDRLRQDTAAGTVRRFASNPDFLRELREASRPGKKR